MVETIRRILMTAVMSIVATGSGAQIVFGLAVSMVFMKLYAYYLPFKEFDNNVLQEVGEETFLISAVFLFYSIRIIDCTSTQTLSHPSYLKYTPLFHPLPIITPFRWPNTKYFSPFK